MIKPDLDHARLAELLKYDSETGEFTWAKKRGTRAAGSTAGTNTSNRLGYRQICIEGKVYLAHRLAWLYVHGDWPTCLVVDHINGDPSDNRISNIRAVSISDNQQNQRKAHISNKHSSLLGASASGNKFRARIRINGNEIHLGSFETAEQAHAAYVEAKRTHHKGNML